MSTDKNYILKCQKNKEILKKKYHQIYFSFFKIFF